MGEVVGTRWKNDVERAAISIVMQNRLTKLISGNNRSGGHRFGALMVCFMTKLEKLSLDQLQNLRRQVIAELQKRSAETKRQLGHIDADLRKARNNTLRAFSKIRPRSFMHRTIVNEG